MDSIKDQISSANLPSVLESRVHLNLFLAFKYINIKVETRKWLGKYTLPMDSLFIHARTVNDYKDNNIKNQKGTRRATNVCMEHLANIIIVISLAEIEHN